MIATRSNYSSARGFALAGRLLFVLAALAVTGCGGGGPAFRATDISGTTEWGRDFALPDAKGQLRRLADFRGKAVVLFFGYTQCPDVCPTTLSSMAEVVKILGSDGAKLQVVFVTLDPERDTPALIAEYMAQFNPGFLGLRGDRAATEAAAKEFKVFYTKQAAGTSGGYTLDHTAGSYVFDPHGRLRLYVRHGAPAADIAADLKLLLAGK
ncbi:SCO family protein [Sulfurisoma sediminicola]|uniref:Protein SCO1/2 n=1 Tax=Sulfurisoma sediminicola TaxID=1381557 RepID=A0A497XJC2_9PROT|nr:SCO family protein [Sulfurisoma sediminicola]RLJ67964.1 protein SCO1/2 [Sulfurisoma sediminicola]